MQRTSGILLPIFSLPGQYGIGSLGKEARAFADFLKEAGQKWWQILPVGPIGAGDSPYASPSTFAGNPLLIDLELLAQDGLLTPEELKSAQTEASDHVDYQAVRSSHEALLRKACTRMNEKAKQAVQAFAQTTPWVRDYALFCAAQAHFGGAAWYDWPDEALRRHEAKAVAHWQEVLSEEIAFQTCVQYWFFQQWAELKAYVNGLGVKLIGDIPIYVSLNSADVWAEREQFLLDEEGKPSKVAGVPPDYFSEDGQLWGNPLYNWEAMKQDGFGWWIRRVAGAISLFDTIRIDHFRGLESYWAIPADAKTAKEGKWEKGPGLDLLKVLTSWFWNVDVGYIAEDLGILTPAVHELRDASGLPGMKVLQFAFDNPANAYLPHHYSANCVCYSGTHDNNTLMGWCSAASAQETAFMEQYLGVSGSPETLCKAILRCGHQSVAALFVAQMQDYLGLGAEARTNVPGVPRGNWSWRMLPDQANPELAKNIRRLTATYGRCAP